MGAQLVKRAFAAVARDPRSLTQNARLVLLWMALTALDTDERPTYFAAREATALAIGRMVPEAVEDDDPTFGAVSRDRESAFRMVQRATTELVERGYIRRRKRGQKWQRAEYEITLPALLSTERSVPPVNERSVRAERDESFVQDERIVRPKEELGTTQEPERGEMAPTGAPHVRVVENSTRRGMAA